MDKETQFEDNKNHYLADRTRTSDEQIKQKMEQKNLKDFLDKTDTVRKRLDQTFSKHKNIIN